MRGRTLLDDFCNRLPQLVGHEADHTEDDETSKETSQAVAEGDDHRISGEKNKIRS